MLFSKKMNICKLSFLIVKLQKVSSSYLCNLLLTRHNTLNICCRNRVFKDVQNILLTWWIQISHILKTSLNCIYFQKYFNFGLLTLFALPFYYFWWTLRYSIWVKVIFTVAIAGYANIAKISKCTITCSGRTNIFLITKY